jgi:hypothetical protein
MLQNTLYGFKALGKVLELIAKIKAEFKIFIMIRLYIFAAITLQSPQILCMELINVLLAV